MHILGITGGTGAGKTHLANRLIDRLRGQKLTVSYLAQDRYYRDLSHLPFEKRYETNFDHPDSMELTLMAEHLEKLKGGEKILAPVFHYVQCTRVDNADTILPADVLVVDGLFLLTDDHVRNWIDLGIYVDVPDDIRLIRRIRRDVIEYEIPLQHVITYWESVIKPMHEEFIAPGRELAKLVVPYWTKADGDRAVREVEAAVKERVAS